MSGCWRAIGRSGGRARCVCAGVGLAALLAAGAGCGQREAPTASAAQMDDVVLTTFAPTRSLAERISGGLVPVRTPLPEGEDPIFWQPTPEAIAEFQRARLIITNGAELEKWVADAPLPASRVVASIGERALADAGGPILMDSVTHSHGPSGEHTHEGVDGHTWVEPTLAIEQAEAIRDAMARAWPHHSTRFEANAYHLVEELRALDDELAALGGAISGVTLLASHPAYNYLARAKGWTITNLDLDPQDQDPAAVVDAVHHALHELEGGDHHHDDHDAAESGHAHGADGAHDGHGAAGDGAPVLLLWEAQPREEIAAALRAELGVASVLFSPGESTARDYLEVLEANIDRLRAALEGQPQPDTEHEVEPDAQSDTEPEPAAGGG